MQNGNNGRHPLQASMNSQSNDDEFYLDPKEIYEQREKLAAKEAREGTVFSKPGAHSSAGSADGSRTTTSQYSSTKSSAAHSVSPSKNTSNTNSNQSEQGPRGSMASEEDDDEFTGYVNPQEIQDQREKLAANDGRQPPSSGNVREVRVGAVPSSSSSHRTTKTAATSSSSHSKGSKKSKSKSKHKSRRHRGGGRSDHPEHARDQTAVQASPVVPVQNSNGDPVLIATATKIESGRRNPSKCWLIFCVLVILAMGGGIGAAVVLLGKSNDETPADESLAMSPTKEPTLSPVASTPSPAGPRPSNQNCNLIENGDDVENQAELIFQRFEISVEVIFSQYPIPGMDEVSGWIHSTILLALANCEIATPQSRALRSSLDRMLQTDKPLVGDAKLDELFVYEDGFCDVDGDTCIKLGLVIDLYLSSDNWGLLELQTLIDSTLKTHAEAEDNIQKIQNVKFLEDDSLDPPVPSTSGPTPSPIQTSPTPTTGRPVTQPTSVDSPTLAPTTSAPIPGVTSPPPVSSTVQPTTNQPMPTVDNHSDCVPTTSYFHEQDQFTVPGEPDYIFFDFYCGEELPVIFIAVGAEDDNGCRFRECIDVLPYDIFEDTCLDEETARVVLMGEDWADMTIVYGYANVDVTSPCTGVSNQDVVVLDD